jgi:2-polyprenyl-3-methyl-5-hydroxy-6-metoxy-1,4-benzoquinol methylase
VSRERARELARRALERGDATGWFEQLYGEARSEADISWADLEPNPSLIAWLDERGEAARLSGRALKVGAGLGDDAEELARRGLAVTAFDVAPTAVAWARRRFPDSVVDYVVADVLAPPPAWRGAFDFVLEAYTLQVLPPDKRPVAARAIAETVAPGGTLLVIARGREPAEDEGAMPWPLTPEELRGLFSSLTLVAFDDFLDDEHPPVRRLRAEYAAPKSGAPPRRS